jgi:hypothetical protein
MKSFFQLSGILGVVLCMGLSSCGRLSPGLSTDYGKVVDASDSEEGQGLIQNGYNTASETASPAQIPNPYGQIKKKVHQPF